MAKQDKIFLLCLNPKCTSPNRCLTSLAIHSHPEQCIHHLYPVQNIVEKDWHQIENYPSDAIGKSISKKLKLTAGHSYISALTKSLKIQIHKVIDQLQRTLLNTYPVTQLRDQFQEIYGLERVAYQLKNNQPAACLNKYLGIKFIPQRMNTLTLLNETYQNIEEMIKNLLLKFQQQVAIIGNKHSRQQRFQIPLDQIQTIKYGLIKSKFIASSKIECIHGHVTFPRLKDQSRFMPWVYSDKQFTSGVHEFKITSGRFPFIPNAGFCVLEESDKDIYPYMHYKSLFSKEGKNFQLVEGDPIEQFISQTAIIKLRLQLEKNPRAIIFDSERNCKYQCQLEQGKKYRMGLYGSGWSVVVIQLT